MIKKFLWFLADLIYPRICPVCNNITRPFRAEICPSCEKKLTKVLPPVCQKCGKPVEDGEALCRDCARVHHIYDRGCAVFLYDEYMSQSMYRFKYNNKREYAHYYGRMMAECLGETIKQWKVDVIVPVPAHKKREKKRGYNQAYLLAKELSTRLDIPVRTDIVIRCDATSALKNLDAVQRQNNIKKAFKVNQNVVKSNSVLIVDDIYTTGATVDAVAGCLKGAGAAKVYFATLCIGRGN